MPPAPPAEPPCAAGCGAQPYLRCALAHVMLPNGGFVHHVRASRLSSHVQEEETSMGRRLILSVLLGTLIAGCAGVQHAERPEGPFEMALLATAETRGELEPCG